MLGLLLAAATARAQDRPNILWLSSEDNGPQIGAYGDAYATTPALDALAARGFRVTRAWSPAPVCAPARTAIITGVLQQTTGGHNMRSEVPLPPQIRMFPALLREAGYYTTNHVKEDYNHPTPRDVWDASSRTAHWRNRRPDQPFFAVFNSVTTHESQIRARPHRAVHDPAKVRVPAFHPDTPEVRQDWAQYYDKITEMDGEVAARLKELADAGLADSTIVVYWGDHGTGLPRGKRWLYPTGLHVPLIIHVPDRFRHLAPEGYRPGAASDRLVSLIDLAPTMLSVAGIRPPDYMHGRAFMGPHAAPARTSLEAGRDRMDERIDLSRAITDGRYHYIRNFRPDRAQGEYLAYMFETPTTQVWKARFDAGTLTPVQSMFWRPKPPEELYDLAVDPDALQNLAGAAAHAAAKARLRDALYRHMVDTRDLGVLPEADMHARRGGRPPYELATDERAFPVRRILAAADRASSASSDGPALSAALADDDPAVRYWAAVGMRLHGGEVVRAAAADLRRLLLDVAPTVRVAAAEALARWGREDDRQHALQTLLACADHRAVGNHVAILALDAVLALGSAAGPIRASAAKLPAPAAGTVPAREQEYVARLTAALAR